MNQPLLVTDRQSLAQARATAPAPIAVVMTMGALHAGHAALIRAARQQAATVIVTIFVNPLQFGADEDYDQYPRTLENDLELCAKEQVDIVFAPSPTGVYPYGLPLVRIYPGPLGLLLEGATRPGHFAGVLTVVLKLLHLTRPDIVVFGEKDYQQLTLVSQLARDTDLDIEIVSVPIVRESDGLALSSRNAYLDEPQREQAVAVFAALGAGAQAGPDGVLAVLAAAESVLKEADLAVDYLELTSLDLGEPPDRGEARLLVAARVGTTRLIDNVAVTLGRQ